MQSEAETTGIAQIPTKNVKTGAGTNRMCRILRRSSRLVCDWLTIFFGAVPERNSADSLPLKDLDSARKLAERRKP